MILSLKKAETKVEAEAPIVEEPKVEAPVVKETVTEKETVVEAVPETVVEKS